MKTDKIKNVIYVMLFTCTYVLAILTWHDTQTAEGTGLYLAILAGIQNRSGFDLLVDAAGAVIILLLALIPCFRICRKETFLGGLLCFFSIGLAFLPFVRPGDLVHFPEYFTAFRWNENLVKGDYAGFIFSDLAELALLFRVVIPLGILFKAVIKIEERTETVNLTRKVKGAWKKIVLCLILILAGILGEDIREEMYFLAVYLFLSVEISDWELIITKNEKLKKWSFLGFAVCALRGSYRLIEIMMTTHM